MNERQFVVFRVFENEFAIPISEVKEIIKTPEITGIPDNNVCLKGIINLRNKVIPIIDLNEKLSLHKENGEQSRIIIIELKQKIVGVTVDFVSEVIKVNEGIIEKYANIFLEEQGLVDGIIKMDNRLIVIINLRELLTKTGVINWQEKLQAG